MDIDHLCAVSTEAVDACERIRAGPVQEGYGVTMLHQNSNVSSISIMVLSAVRFPSIVIAPSASAVSSAVSPSTIRSRLMPASAPPRIPFEELPGV